MKVRVVRAIRVAKVVRVARVVQGGLGGKGGIELSGQLKMKVNNVVSSGYDRQLLDIS